MQVLEGLSSELALEVLRSTPGSFAHKLIQLPQSLRPLAVLADVPDLTATCSPADMSPGTSAICSEHDLPVLTFCVAPNHAASGGTSDDSDENIAAYRNAAFSGDAVDVEDVAAQSAEVSK